MSRLEIIIGPMMGGKTTEIFRRISTYQQLSRSPNRAPVESQLRPLKALYVNHYNDSRSNKEFSSHNPVIRDGDLKDLCAKIKVKNLQDLYYIIDDTLINPEEFDIIAIDEGQFFDDLVDTVTEWVESGKVVIVAGLNGDFAQRKFGTINDLIPQADSVDFVYPWCTSCYHRHGLRIPAAFTKRHVKSSDVVLIGDSEQYSPSCRKCLYQS